MHRIKLPPGDAEGFTLVEMLIVIAIVVLLSALLLPSMQGLFGVVGRRGGANTLALGFEQARLEAVKHGTPAFVGFANAASEDALSSFIIYRALRFDEAVTNTNRVVPISRWMRLPKGVFLAPTSVASAVTRTQSFPAGVLPRLAGSNVVSVRSIQFDRFGKLASANTNPPALRVGEGVFIDGNVTFKPNESNYYELSIQPLTGQVVMRDGAISQQ